MTELLGTTRDVYALVRPRDRAAIILAATREALEKDSERTGYLVERWSERLEEWPGGAFTFWNLRRPEGIDG